MTNEPSETIGERISKYERRVQMSTWLGASLAGFIALVVGDVIPESPTIFKPIVVSLLLIAATSAANTRVGFEWSATLLKRRLKRKETGLDENASLPQDLTEWPHYERWWLIFLWSYMLSGVTFLTAIWWNPVAQLINSYICKSRICC